MEYVSNCSFWLVDLCMDPVSSGTRCTWCIGNFFSRKMQKLLGCSVNSQGKPGQSTTSEFPLWGSFPNTAYELLTQLLPHSRALANVVYRLAQRLGVVVGMRGDMVCLCAWNYMQGSTLCRFCSLLPRTHNSTQSQGPALVYHSLFFSTIPWLQQNAYLRSTSGSYPELNVLESVLI